MAVFKYELRQLRFYTLGWAAACGLFIFSMLPIYLSFLTSGTMDVTGFADNDFFKMLGVTVSVITTPVGTFGFLTSFFAIPAGINGMFLGLHTFSKETVGRSAEFLYTKPCKRAVIFVSKAAAGLVSALITGGCYFLGALASGLLNITGGFDKQAFCLIALSFTLVELFFVFLGALTGVLWPKARTPLLASAGVAFCFYVLAAFSSKANLPLLKFFTPYSWFSASGIVLEGFYAPQYLAAFCVFCVLFAFTGYRSFCKKDVTLLA